MIEQIFTPVKQLLADGMTLHKQDRLQMAEQKYFEVLQEDPDNVDALYLLASIYMKVKKLPLASQLFLRVTVLNNEHFEAWNNLGNCYKAFNKEDVARECWEAALNIMGRADYEYADIYNNLGTLYVNSGEPEKALPLLNKCLELRPEHQDGKWNMSLVQLELGNYEEGFRGYPAGFHVHHRLYRDYHEKGSETVVEWMGEGEEETKDKTIVVWGEQGIGDELMFASCIPDLAQRFNKVIFDCHPRLVGIFKQSFPDNVVCYGTRKENMIGWPGEHPELQTFAYKKAIGDVPQYLRKTVDDFPKHDGYLKADPERVEHYRQKLNKLGDRLKIGISWTGGYHKTRKDYRSVMLDKWADIFKLDADFISLQYTKEAYKTVAHAEEMFGIDIHHWPQAVEAHDYMETASLIEALDIVITVNTAAHHMAGALGKPCFTLTPVAKAWRYYSPAEDNSTIPWYPSVHQFQQKELFEWDDVMKKVALWAGELIEAHDILGNSPDAISNIFATFGGGYTGDMDYPDDEELVKIAEGGAIC
jgi:tetratricopeptide (TPR) repeat protein